MHQKFGQNFLSDKTIAKNIVNALELSKDDTVLEIGPGKGVLTSLINGNVKRFIAVEIDRNLAAGIRQKFPNTEVYETDFLHFSPPQEWSNIKIISNLPYYCATAIIESFLSKKYWSTAVVMIQKEVAERIMALPDTKDYGYLTILSQYYASFQKVLECGPESFSPPPRVKSIVMKVQNSFKEAPPEGFFRVVKAAFSQRRKTILNSLSAGLKLPKPTILEVLNKTGIKEQLRPEDLPITTFLNLTNQLKSDKIL